MNPNTIKLFTDLNDVDCSKLIEDAKGGNVVDAGNTEIARDCFSVAIRSLPSSAAGDGPWREHFLFLVHVSQFDDYFEYLESRQTVRGDTTPIPRESKRYGGVRIIPVDWLPDDVVLLIRPENVLHHTGDGKNELSIVDNNKSVIVINIAESLGIPSEEPSAEPLPESSRCSTCTIVDGELLACPGCYNDQLDETIRIRQERDAARAEADELKKQLQKLTPLPTVCPLCDNPASDGLKACPECYGDQVAEAAAYKEERDTARAAVMALRKENADLRLKLVQYG